eukprot:SAG11_NODE_15280_length_583_cov_0.962810_1_plen_65_part_10
MVGTLLVSADPVNALVCTVRTYSETGSDSFPYRDQLRRNLAREDDRYILQIDMEDLAAWEEPLAA